MRHGLAGQRRGRGATRIRASSWWVVRRSGSGLRAARSVSMRCGCGRCAARPPCQRSDGCRLSRIKAPSTLARERDSMRHTKPQSQAGRSTDPKLDDDAQRSSPPRSFMSIPQPVEAFSSWKIGTGSLDECAVLRPRPRWGIASENDGRGWYQWTFVRRRSLLGRVANSRRSIEHVQSAKVAGVLPIKLQLYYTT